jgi:hypothetical protein
MRVGMAAHDHDRGAGGTAPHLVLLLLMLLLLLLLLLLGRCHWGMHPPQHSPTAAAVV